MLFVCLVFCGWFVCCFDVDGLFVWCFVDGLFVDLFVCLVFC